MQTPTPDIAHGGSYQVDPATGAVTLISRAQQHPEDTAPTAEPAQPLAPKPSSKPAAPTVQLQE
jgi:hypothetical protein